MQLCINGPQAGRMVDAQGKPTIEFPRLSPEVMSIRDLLAADIPLAPRFERDIYRCEYWVSFSCDSREKRALYVYETEPYQDHSQTVNTFLAICKSLMR